MASSSTTTHSAGQISARPGLFPLGQVLASLTVSAVKAAFNIPSLLVEWQKRDEMRNHLAQLDAHMLQDMGLTETDVRREIEKPFWIS